MKKTTILLLASAFLAAGCSRAELDENCFRGTGEPGTIRLAVKSADIVRTKAERPGDDDGSYNENKIYSLDYFLFKSAPADGSVPFKRGRFTYDPDGISPTTPDVARANARTINFGADDYDEGETKNCYVFVIANLPAAPADGLTYAELQALPLGFSAVVGEDGRFKAQTCFPMTGSGALTPIPDEGGEILVNLERRSSKITVDVNVIKMIEQYNTNYITQQEEYVGTWFPNIDKVQVYMTYANGEGLVSGVYGGRKYADDTYFTYPRTAFKPAIRGDGSYQMSTIAKYQNTDASGAYYTPDPDLVGKIVVDGSGNPVYIEGATYPAFEVTGTPFYSYPTTWETSEAHAPFIKVIIPWVKYYIPTEVYHHLAPGDTYNSFLSAVLDHDFPASIDIGGNTYWRSTTQAEIDSRGGEESYYKISIPALREGSATTCALQANHWYHLKMDIAVLGGESDDASIIVDGSAMGLFVADWSDPHEQMNSSFAGGRYLSTAKNAYEFYAASSIEIPVISSHPITIPDVSATYSDLSADIVTTGSLTRSTTSSTGTNFMITASPDGDRVTITHTMVSTIADMHVYDISPITYTFRIQHADADNAGYYKDVTVTQYPSLYIINDLNTGQRPIYYGTTGTSSSGSNYYDLGNVRINNAQGHTNTALEVRGIRTDANGNIVTTITNQNPNMYVITTTVLDPDLDYILGDPRTNTINNLFTSASAPALYPDGTANRRLTYYYPTDESSRTENMIAPSFRIASSYGKVGNTKTRSEMLTRCASYQEDGYPAGRWRFPTNAELAYMTRLSAQGLIPSLFTSGSGTANNWSGTSYWTAQGRLGVLNSGNILVLNSNTSTSAAVRCVYDEWYWGSEKVPVTQFTWGDMPRQ